MSVERWVIGRALSTVCVLELLAVLRCGVLLGSGYHQQCPTSAVNNKLTSESVRGTSPLVRRIRV